MRDSDLISSVSREIQQRHLTQMDVARQCGLSQPHISKVLAKNIKLAKKTRSKLALWLTAAKTNDGAALYGVLVSIHKKIEKLPAGRRNQFMQFLESLDGCISGE
jgi:transcriptional regulator with XRE-family HTH domain